MTDEPDVVPPLNEAQEAWVNGCIKSHASRLVRRALVLVVLVAAVGSFGTWRAETAADSATDAVNRIGAESIDRQVAQCTSANEFRRLFRGYLEAQGNGVNPDDITELDGFDALTPAAQEYVRALAALVASNAANARQVRDDYVAKFPLQDCKALRRTLERSNPSTTPNIPAAMYRTCAEAADADDTPLRKGDPGYNPALDGDEDGIACE